MKLIRNISAAELIEKLKVFGYKPTRQTGSHIPFDNIPKRYSQHYYS